MTTVQTPLGPFQCWPLDDLTRALEAGAWWDAHIQPAIDATPTDGWAIDLGANIGWFTRYFAARGFAHVLAVEAHPQTAALLAANVADLPTVEVVVGAAYDRDGVELALASAPVHGWPEGERDSYEHLDLLRHVAGFSFVEDLAQQHPAREWVVQTVTLDRLVPPMTPVRLLKIDVQGAALRALHGAERILGESRPRVILEYEGLVSECRGDNWAAYTRFFETHGYTLERIPGPWSEWLALP